MYSNPDAVLYSTAHRGKERLERLRIDDFGLRIK